MFAWNKHDDDDDDDDEIKSESGSGSIKDRRWRKWPESTSLNEIFKRNVATAVATV